MIVEGQLHGGIAQGIAQALFEEVVYDPETGQLMTGSLIDYLVPTANEIPTPMLGPHGHAQSRPTSWASRASARPARSPPAPRSSTPSSMRSSPLGIKHVDMPASPDRLWKQIQAAQSSNGGARMIPAAFEYKRASSVDEASQLLSAGRATPRCWPAATA